MASPSPSAAIPQDTGCPEHIAIIMDGNGRWAQERHLPRIAGHAKGVQAVHATINACIYQGIGYLTLFAFSSENWRRPPGEVSFLMRLFRTVLKREVRRMMNKNVRFIVAGDLTPFDDELRAVISYAESTTSSNTGLTLTVCANYGGRWDLIQAVQKVVAQGLNTAIQEEDLTPHLAMAHAPEPDLLIRTGGEKRISNFLLWQLAYTELYFTDLFWPDFGAIPLSNAIESFQNRERRFGKTSEQTLKMKLSD